MMKASHRRTLERVRAKPTPGNIVFADIERLLVALGCEMDEGAGSRAVFRHDAHSLHLHRQHPQKEAKRYQVEEVREFLNQMG